MVPRYFEAERILGTFSVPVGERGFRTPQGERLRSSLIG